MYFEFAKIAKKEGYDHIASLFLGVANIEKFHQNRYEDLKKELISKKNFVDTKEIY
jgi:rubrerythrin